MSADAAIAACMRAADLALRDFNLYISEHRVACEFWQWERAEQARVKTVSAIEAHMDALHSLSRHHQMAAHGG